MGQTIESKNKALVLEAFDTLFNKRDYKALRSRLIRARARRILNETALLAIYLLLFAWNILNVRFV